jgi:hypothetical protein
MHSIWLEIGDRGNIFDFIFYMVWDTPAEVNG